MPDKRDDTRIQFRAADNLKVRYKFLSRQPGFRCDDVFEGTVLNLSEGGALIEGRVPGTSWLQSLGRGDVLIGVNVMVPDRRPVKALATLRWSRPALNPGCYELGLQFQQLEDEHRGRLSRFLIHHQIRTRKFGRRPLEL